MEVVHRRVEEEEQLRTRRQEPEYADPSGYVSSDDASSDGMKEELKLHQNGVSVPKSVYLDNNEDSSKIQWSVSGEDEVEISKLVNAVMKRESIIGEVKIEEERVGAAEETMNVISEDDEEEEEEIEVELERAVDKAHTHTPFCPNCSNQITKVILRRKKRVRTPPPPPLNLLGCLTCFTIFIPSGDGLSPFGFFGSKPKLESPQVEDVQPSTHVAAAAGKHSLNPFNCFGYKPKQESPKTEDEQPSTDTTSKAEGVVSSVDKREDSEKGESSKLVREFEAKFQYPTHHVTLDIEAKTDTTIILERGGGDINLGVGEQVQPPPISAIHHRSISLDILKCIVYGGLLQSIASLSVVSSAAASDATTLNVVTIGLATVFGGLIAFGYNLLDLRNEVGSNEKYEQVLGRKGHFLFHSTFAVFSYLVFGFVAPTTYGFAFRESDDKDYKIIAVAVAGFACVLLLSIGKAYVKGADRLGSYVKTILYYVTMAISVSGVAYAAGDLIGMLLDKFGLFESPQGLTSLASPTSTWASY